MLRIIQNTSAGGAKGYYSTADYFTEGQELAGTWRGTAAARLGLSGSVEQAQWDALCDNRDPSTGQTLTARTRGNRTVGYDFNFHAPKSLSLLHALTQDERLLSAFRESVDETMVEMERELKTRVRTGGRDEDRTAGNAVWGEFVHLTSRPVGGVPDPHLHAHCFVFNAVHDPEEHRFKAANFKDLKRDAPYFEAVFHAKLADRMVGLGLPVERTRQGWEIGTLDRSTLARFSRRTAQVEAEAAAKGITSAAAKSELGARTRERKQKHLTMDELRAEWRSRLSEDEAHGVDRLAARVGRSPTDRDERSAVANAVDLALDHCFERQSVVPERTLLREALRRSYGLASGEAVEGAVDRPDLIRGEREERRWVTTKFVLAEESRMLEVARSGRGTCRPLGDAQHTFKDERLNAGQRQAVLHVLTSPDRVTVIRGAAGVGKTTLMVEAVAAIEAGGTQVFTFAPSADASRGVLRSEGFANADTVARLLVDPAIQEQARGQVLWVDEAGLLGTRTMARLFDLAEHLDARVILSGDHRQHGSVERGAALRLLETEAGVVPAEVREIKRQQGAYRSAIAALSEGRTADGFAQLDAMGCIREVANDGERYERLSAEYVALTGADGPTSTLVVSPTHREGREIADQIRFDLKRLGRLGTDERTFEVLTPAHLTRAERADRVSLEPGDVLVYHRASETHRRGDRVVVGRDVLPPAQDADRFTVYHAEKLRLAAGDVVRLTANGKTENGHRLNNGATYGVAGFTAAGEVRLSNGWVIPRSYNHLAQGYVSTSHNSQGKSVKHVLVGQSSTSFPASSAEQWYVSVSRGKRSLAVYTDDKAVLRAAVDRSDARVTATEFVAARRKHRDRALTLHRLAQLHPPPQPSFTPQKLREYAHER